MVISIYLSLAILLIHIAYHMRKPLSFLQSSLIFMVTATLTRQCITLMAMEWKLIHLTEDYWLFICLLLCRELFTPMATVIFANTFLRSGTPLRKAASFILSLLLLLAFNYLAVKFEIITYKNWNFFYTILMNAGFLLVGLGVMKLTFFIQKEENPKHESI